MQEELLHSIYLLQLDLDRWWHLPHGKKALGYTQEEGIDYNEVLLASSARLIVSGSLSVDYPKLKISLLYLVRL
ncbi:hypothetical protein Tco_0693063 [Tanacetum coccineum]